LGIFVPFANSKGALAGTFASLSFSIWLFVGFNVYDIKYPKKELFTYGCAKEKLSRRILGLDDEPRRPFLLRDSTLNSTQNHYYLEK
jgi:hypothetical protein